jgi:carboxymethylenebutenolidase
VTAPAGPGSSLLLAPAGGFTAAAVNYGPVPENAEAALAGACPIVASYGGADRALPTVHPERLRRALVVLEIPHDVHVYPGAGHRFMSEATGAAGAAARLTGTSYQRHDAADAWQRTYAFLGRYLEPAPSG